MADEHISVSATGLGFYHEPYEISSVKVDPKSFRVRHQISRPPVLTFQKFLLCNFYLVRYVMNRCTYLRRTPNGCKGRESDIAFAQMMEKLENLNRP
jgi:hypothetical protein